MVTRPLKRIRENNFVETKVLFVTEENSGKRLDVFISSNEKTISRNRAQNIIARGLVSKNEIVLDKPSYIVKFNDYIKVVIEEPIILSAKPQDIPLDIIYEDSELLVINKARGMVVHPALGNPDGTLVNALMNRVTSLSSINGVIRPGIVHRLDKNTTGLMVVAKNDAAHNNLSSQFSKRTMKKIYVGLVEGKIDLEEGIIEMPIARNTNGDRKKMTVNNNGRYAKTSYKVIEKFSSYTLLEFTLHTGRTHQIRVHCKFINHPIVGDPLYGKPTKLIVDGQLLHSFYLEFSHPLTGERMGFKKEIPDDFKRVLDLIRK